MNNALEVGEFTLHFGSEVDDVNLGMGEQWWLTLMTTYTGNIIKVVVVSDQKTTHVHYPKANIVIVSTRTFYKYVSSFIKDGV